MSKKFSLGNSIRIILSDPKHSAQLVRIGIRKYIKNPISYTLFGNNTAFPPIQIGLKLTNRCNMRCCMCAQWGESGYHLQGDNKIPLQKEIDTSYYLQMISTVRKYKPHFYIWGGEPLLYKGLFEIISEMNKNHLVSSLVTNAYQLEENAEKIVKDGPSVLFISFDGPEHIHDSVRNCTGSYSRIISALSKIRRLKNELKSSTPHCVGFFTICKQNVDYITESFKLMESIGFEFAFGFFSWFTNNEIGEKHRRLMKKLFDCDAVTWKGYVYEYNSIHAATVKDQIVDLKNTNLKMPYTLIPNLAIDQIETYYSDPSNTFSYNKCIYPWDTVEIQPNGDVVPCRDFPDYITGNITKTSLLDLFNCERYRMFRKEIRKGLFPICSRCCGLMGL